MSCKRCEYGKIIKAQYDFECDRCGHPIRAGEECRIILDRKKKRAFFVHRHCPTACAILCIRTPVGPAMRLDLAFA